MTNDINQQPTIGVNPQSVYQQMNNTQGQQIPNMNNNGAMYQGSNMNNTQGNTNAQQQPQQNGTLDEFFLKEQQTWVDDIKTLNEKMKDLPKLYELLNEIYETRQVCVAQHSKINLMLLQKTTEFKAKYNYAFNNYKLNGASNGMRFSSDSAIQRQIEVDLQVEASMIEVIKNHRDYLEKTIESIDAMRYGIPQKVRIYEIMNGIKNI